MSAFLPHPLDQGHTPEWASAWGEDRFGPFVVFEVGGVEQRMRWIRPGVFWMGSPKNEARRHRDEIHHEVTLTQGFWLADTPCTQALWQAVMHENPSRFVHPERPVDRVSFEDVERFCQALGEQVSDLQPRLPTVAEWERACRAGSQEATYAGNPTMRGQHAAELESIAWYDGNSGKDFDLAGHKRGTRIVAQKMPNVWGLYDMLGNVWEWCQDWYGSYDTRATLDPQGSAQGTSRVLRGASWFSNALHVRAAYRRHGEPSYRRDSLGFRLAGGPGLRSSARGAQGLAR